VEHQGSQIRARFWQRWPEEGDRAAAATVAAVRGTGRGSAALQGVGLRLFFYSRDRVVGARCVTASDASGRLCWIITLSRIHMLTPILCCVNHFREFIC
jgi:hypothetical protein